MQQPRFKGLYHLAFAMFVLGAAATGCDDDEDDVVLPDGDVVEFDDLDVDGDGEISAAEWTSGFDTWDVDNDGVIDADEWTLGVGLGAYDTDGDGELSAAEYANSFGALDADGDGFLDADELGF